MRTWVFICACVILLGAALPIQPQQPQQEVLLTRFRQFTIPFSLPEKTTPPVTVELHVSSDRGTTWRLVESLDRASGRFQFRTDRDGTYWFCSTTLFADGRTLPTTFKPEIKVRVDATHPTIQITPQVTPGGRISLECRANDQVFAVHRLKLEYITGNEESWQPVPVSGPAQLVAPGSLLLVASWQPTTPSRLVTIKASVRDQAGNITVVHRRVFLPPLSLRRPSKLPAPVANDDNSQSNIPWPADNQPARPAPESLPLADPPTPGPIDGAPPVETPAPEVKAQPVDPLPQITLPETEPGKMPVEVKPSIPPARPLPEMLTDPRPPAQTMPQPSVQESANTRFHLEYELDPNLVVSEVQLWGTLDGGKSWQKWGTDQDRTSPLDIDTKKNGLFGFRVVVLDAEGRSDNTPTAGADADVWVRVER
jgi:hypothetical protein